MHVDVASKTSISAVLSITCPMVILSCGVKDRQPVTCLLLLLQCNQTSSFLHQASFSEGPAVL